MGDHQIIGGDAPEGHKYPPYRKEKIFEEYACDYFRNDPRFIPVYWTRIINTWNNQIISHYVERLNKIVPVAGAFTIATHDDAPFRLWGDRVKYFSAGGKVKGTIPIPLIAPNFPYKPLQKDIFAHFSGSITHPIRGELLELTKEHRVVITLKAWSPNLSILDERCNFDLMARSMFAFCPRGYGTTSFRLYEALHLACIPIYASDEHWLPFQSKIDWEKLAILCNSIKEGYAMAKAITNERALEMVKYAISVRHELTDFDAVCKNIQENLNGNSIGK